MQNVVCLKWGDKYSPEYVNNLYSMCSRHITDPFRFVCITDDDTGLDSNVEAIPLLDSDLPGWWGKVSYFKDPLADIVGPTLALDLDLVIVGSLDPFFKLPGEFCIEKDFHEPNGNNSSVMRFEANEHSDIYDEFDLSMVKDNPRKYWGDQAWITEKRPKAKNWPPLWVRSYKYECRIGIQFEIPFDCKIVMFHGHPRPHEALHHIRDLWK